MSHFIQLQLYCPKRSEVISLSYIDELFKSGVWATKTPKEPDWINWAHKNLSENHCPECLMLDGCYFLKEKAPKHPHHPY